jgi:Tol biopolymer transport system component
MKFHFSFITLLLLCVSTWPFSTDSGSLVDLPDGIKKLLPSSCDIVTSLSADLNGDGANDFIVVIQRSPGTTEATIQKNARELALFINFKSGYVIAAKTRNAVLCSACGTPGADPFCGITADKRSFSIRHSGGKEGIWENTATFSYSRGIDRWNLVDFRGKRAARGQAAEPFNMTVKDFGDINLENFDIYRYMEKGTVEKQRYIRPSDILYVGNYPSRLWSVNPDGSLPLCLQRADGLPYVQQPSCSPDRSKILYTTGYNQLYVMNADGTDDRMLPPESKGLRHNPAWSPDGNLIAFIGTKAGGVSGLCVANPDGSDIRWLTKREDNCGHFSWSPDSRRIVFNSGKNFSDRIKNYSESIYIADLSGNVSRMTNGNDFYPEWSPAGDKILFHRRSNSYDHLLTIDLKKGNAIAKVTDTVERYSHWDSSGKKILLWRSDERYEINPDGSGLKKLDAGPAPVAEPSLPVAGPLRFKNIAAGSTQRNESGSSRMDYIVIAKGFDQAKFALVTFLPGTGDMFLLTSRKATRVCPSWSPDHKRIAFHKDDGRIYTIDQNGKNEKTIIDGLQLPIEEQWDGIGSIKWAPDGKQIVFIGALYKGFGSMYISSIDGKTIRRIKQGGQGIDYADPSWSPDSKYIVFVKEINGEGGCIFSLDLNTGEEKRLTGKPGVYNRDKTPAWSPDGKTIIFSRDYYLYLMDADGGNQKKVNTQVMGHSPAWSPDGNRIVFFSPNMEVYVMEIEGDNAPMFICEQGDDSPSWW